jgi:parallel beta-helix repeat protein
MTYNQLLEWNGENGTDFMTWNITKIQGDLIDLHLVSHGINVTDGNVTITTGVANLTINASTREVISCSDPYYIGEKWPFWIETNVTLGSVIDIWYGVNTINGDERITILGNLRDCWVVEYTWATASMKRWYDKTSGIVLKIHVIMHHQNITTETTETATHTNLAQYLRVHNINSGMSYTTIQEAISTVETLDGHAIIVDAGIYYEHVTINKSISLIGEDKNSTIIDGAETGSVVSINSDLVTIRGFTIRNSGFLLHNIPSGIEIAASNCTVFDNIITNCKGGCALAWGGNHTITNNTISENYYGIYIVYSVDNRIFHNRFLKNTNQTYSTGATNIWDNGFPSGGNYWSDYEDRYPNASEIDGSDIWNTPYDIFSTTAQQQDNYPLIPEFSSLFLPLLMLVASLSTLVYKYAQKIL